MQHASIENVGVARDFYGWVTTEANVLALSNPDLQLRAPAWTNTESEESAVAYYSPSRCPNSIIANVVVPRSI